MKKRNNPNNVLWIVLVVISIVGIISVLTVGKAKTSFLNISYDEFQQLVAEGKVDAVIWDGGYTMTAELYNSDTVNMPYDERVEYKYDSVDKRIVTCPSNDSWIKDLLEAGVRIDSRVENSTALLVAVNIIPMLIILVVYVVVITRLTPAGKNSSWVSVVEDSDKKFDDVIGHDEILEDIKFLTEIIKNPKLAIKAGARVPKGFLLSGDPGTGKTLIAKAIAGEAGVPFIYANGGSFLELYVGVGPKRIRELFRKAKKLAPCIIFIDEIDALGKRDSAKSNGEEDRTLNELLTQLDGFKENEGIFVIGATNRPELIDSALKRAGRFDREIVINPPSDWTVRKELFEKYFDHMKLAEDVSIDVLSKQVAGFTGADIEAITNEAALIAAMSGRELISMADIEEAVDKRVFKGSRSKKEKFKKDKEIIAYHEAGHAVMSYLCSMPVARASIQSMTGGVGGAVFQSDKDSMLKTKTELEDEIMVALAGRASEAVMFGDVTTGASNDITKATSILYEYIYTYGFDKDFGIIDVQAVAKLSSSDTDRVSAEYIAKMANNYYDKCFTAIKRNFKLVEVLAKALLEQESISGEDITDLLSKEEVVW